MEFLTKVWDAVKPYLPAIGLAVTWLGILYLAWRQRANFRSKRSDRVNFSVNYLLDGRLAMRTLLETTPKEVWLNDYGVRLVVAAAGRTTAEQPFIVLKDPADLIYVKKALKNALSEHFAEAYLAEAMGVPARKATFLFALTYERYESSRELKFRVIVVEEAKLQEMFGAAAAAVNVLNERHKDRLAVLRTMAELAAKPGSLVEGVNVLDKVELGIVL